MYCHEQIKTYSLTCKKLKKKFSHNRVNPQQSISLGEKLLLQRDDNDLHVAAGLLPEETGHLDSKQQFFKTTRYNKNRKIKSKKLLSIFTFPMLVLSSAASTSSKTKNGAGQKLRQATQTKINTHYQPAVRVKWSTLTSGTKDESFLYMSEHSCFENLEPLLRQGYLWMANRRAKEAMAFSPPDRLSMEVKRFPGATQL